MFESKINRGRANGYAPLDGSGKVPLDKLPPIQSTINTGSFVTTNQTGSFATTSSLQTLINVTGSFVTTSSFNLKTGSFATTGSNQFYGNQSISGSVNISSSLVVSSTFVNNGTIDALNSDLIIDGGDIILSGSQYISGGINFNDGTIQTTAFTGINSSSFASTGSNQFNGNQTITGSLVHGNAGNIATGENSHAEGEGTHAIGNFSHAEGLGTIAYANYSHAEGQDTIASGSHSHAEGNQTIALANHQHVQGQYNVVSSAPAAFIVGNGTDAENRSNLIHAAGNEVQITGSLIVSSSGTFTNIGPANFIGSNTFIGNQTISGSLYFGSGSIYKATDASIVIGTPPLAENITIFAADTSGSVYRLFINASAYPNLPIIPTGSVVITNWGAQVTATVQEVIDDRIGGGVWVFIFNEDVDTGFDAGPRTATFGQGLQTWTFGDNGTLTTPGDINVTGSLNVSGSVYADNLVGLVSSSSQLATSFPSKTTGNWTIPNGASTQSFTVDPNSSYTMWVNGNIPNGIITWNATATISNTNVPVLGAQYGWYYTAGNALVLTTMPDQFVGTNGTISTSPGSYAPNTSNVFKFGITNNSGTTQSINYGYIKLS